MTDPPVSPNEFEPGKSGSLNRDRSEALIEGVRLLGGVFVDAVRATRGAMVLTDPRLPGNPIVFANAAFLDLSGYSMAEVLGQQPFFMNGPGTDPDDAGRFTDLFDADQDAIVETVQYGKDGRKFVASVLLSAFKDAEGRTLHHFLTWNDITRRVEAETDLARVRPTEAALRESEAKYRTLFETMGQGFCELELIRNDEGEAIDQRYLALNPAFERLFRISVAEAVGKKASDYFPDLDPVWTKTFAHVVETRSAKRIEHRVSPGGRWFEVCAYPTGGDRLIVTYDDISDRKLTEESQRAIDSRNAFLLKLSDALQPIAGAEEIQVETARLIGEYLDVDRAMYGEVTGDHGAEEGTIRVQYVRPPSSDLPIVVPFPKHFAFESYGIDSMASRYRGETLVVEDIATETRFTDQEKAAWQAAGVRAALVVPMAKEGRLRAEFGVHCVTPREWSDADISIVREVAERTWAAAERARAEAALLESKERLSLAIEVGQLASWDWDLGRDHVSWNDRHFMVQGYEVGEVTPSFEAWLARVHPEDRSAAMAAIDRARTRAEFYSQEFRILRPDGSVRWCAARGRFFYDSDGKSERMIGVMEDVTERKASEATLRQNEQRFRLIVENARDYAIFTTDTEGLIDQWYEGAEEVFGWSAEEAIGQPIDITFTPEDRRQGQPAIELQGAAENGRVLDLRWHIRKDGRRIFIDGISSALRAENGRLSGFLKIGQDVTERRRSEERQKTLLAELQHRVRNIMAMMRSVARRTGETAGTVEDYVQHLEGRISAMARTQALLTREVNAAVDLKMMVLDELNIQAAKAGRYSIRGENVDLPPKAAEVLGLAIHELATNSIKYGALRTEDGKIDVRWTVAKDAQSPRLRFCWAEFGVQMDDAPTRQGFGTELITQRVPYELGGTGGIEFRPTGIVAIIEFPLEQAQSILQTDAGR